jgi:hypothetical protein
MSRRGVSKRIRDAEERERGVEEGEETWKKLRAGRSSEKGKVV